MPRGSGARSKPVTRWKRSVSMKSLKMAGLAALLLGGIGFAATQEAQAGCPGGSCGSRSYSGGYYSGGYSTCGPNGCGVPAYRSAPPGTGAAPSAAYRAPNYRSYAYRTQTYYRAPRVYTGGRTLNGRIATAPRPAQAAVPAGQSKPAQLQLNAPQPEKKG